jgi:hypothetical protein
MVDLITNRASSKFEVTMTSSICQRELSPDLFGRPASAASAGARRHDHQPFRNENGEKWKRADDDVV